MTSAIKQDGANQVNIITSTADREAAIEFAKAAAIRPQVIGTALAEISQDPIVCESMFQILETQKLTEGTNELILVPDGSKDLLTNILVGKE